jgi:hypothetical protein
MLNVKKAMINACTTNNIEIVRYLVSSCGGFNLNQTVVQKKSPLYAACEGGHVELA